MNLNKMYNILPIWSQNILISIYGFILKKQRYNSDFEKYLNQLIQLDLNKPQKLLNYQEIQLRKTVVHAYETVPYYKKLFLKIDFNPYNFTIRDFKRIPFLSKEDLIKNSDSLVSNDYSKKKLKTIITSGSTGKPVKLFIDKNVFTKEYAFVYYKPRINVKPHERRATFNGRLIVKIQQDYPPFWRYNYSRNQTLYSSYHMKEHNLKFYIEDLNKKKPSVIEGYPSNLYILSDFIITSNFSLNFRPKSIFTS